MKNFMKHITIILVAGMGLAFGGPAANLISQLKAAGDGSDIQVRTDLRNMTQGVMAPPVVEADRAAVEADLIAALQAGGQPVTVRQLLVREIERCGGAASIGPLGAVLGDDDLVEPAAQALISIYHHATMDEQAKEVIRTAMATATGGNLNTLMKAAGSLQDQSPAVQAILLANAASADWATQATALRSLANIGDPGARTALSAALSTDNAYHKAEIIKWNMLYSYRLAQRGDKETGMAICNELDALADAEDLGGIQSSCFVKTAVDLTLSEIDEVGISIKREKQTLPGLKPGLELTVTNGLMITVTASQAYEINISDIKGHSVWSTKGDESAQVKLPKNIFRAGVYTVSVVSGHQRVTKSMKLQ